MADILATFQYPTVVSRTLDPNQKALRTIVALHDHEITDADLNVMQDLQDSKRAAVLDSMVSSGSLTYAPMQFNPNNPNAFLIPGFDVLFNGQVVTVTGNQSADITMNRVNLPVPAFWSTGTNEEDARIYVVFLELWYQSLNPITGQGYYQDPITKLYYFYPYGGLQPDPSNAEIVPDDSTDPFQGLFTTERAQIQWRLNVQRVGLNYNFSQYKFGLDPDTTDVPSFPTVLNSVYAQAGLATQTPGQSPLFGLAPYQFTYMGGNPNIPQWVSTTNYVGGNIVLFNGVYYVAFLPNTNVPPPNPAYWNPFPINGDTGLWVAGDGNVNNSLGTMDGYSYAMPVAVVFQRNTGNFNVTNNLFGCANPAISVAGNGTLASGVSGRFDSELADQIFPADTVDTRSIVQLQGTPLDQSMRFGFGDLVTGNTRLAISRGSAVGNKAEALGSTLAYNVSVAPTSAAVNVDLLGQWDGFANGFSSDQRTFSSTFQITPAQKTTGTQNSPWVLGDSFTVSLPTSSNAAITSIEVTALVSNTLAGTLTPAALLQGQFSLTGLNSKSVTTQFIVNLTGTAFDPGANNLYVTVGVTYPAGSALNLKQIPILVDGGLINDQIAGTTFPVYGVSEYAVTAQQVALPPANPSVVSQGIGVNAVFAYNPEYSNILFGTKIQLAVPGSLGVQQTVGGSTITTFILPMMNIEGAIDGLYCTHAFDSITQVLYPIGSRTMGTVTDTPSPNTQTVVVIQQAVPANSTVIFSILAQNTAQLAYNAPVKGVTQIEETVLFGNFTTDSNYPMDGRVVVENVSTAIVNAIPVSTIVLGANGCTIKGVSGDNVNFFCWVANQSIGQPFALLTAVQIQSINFINGTIVITVPNVTLAGPNSQPFFICGSILPAFSPQSSLIIEEQYIPYQGEGVLGRNYEILHSEDNALVTTNGTGAAPVIGLSDVYPYNRELPIITMLPAQPSWPDSGLTNTPVASLFDSNYVAMRADNVEDTFDVPLHTNDFIPPINKDTRKTIAFTSVAAGGRGFAAGIPHLGFAITAVTPRTVLGQNLQTTIAPITLYVDNAIGNDANSGLSLRQAKKSIGAALALLPPVLTFPCVILINDTGVPFTISQITAQMEIVALGDGDIRSAKIYCLGNLSRVIQEEGRLVISAINGATNPVVIDATGWGGFGDGPTSAFYIDTSRVILNGLQFVGFQNPVITAYNADIDMVGCEWVGNVQAGQYIGCDSVIFDGGSLSVPDGAVGQVAVQSNVTASNVVMIAGGPTFTPGAFFAGSRGSTLNFQTHTTSLSNENSATTPTPTPFPPTAVVAEAQLNSSISVTSDFQTNGSAVLQANSVLSQTAVQTPFLGGVTADASSSVVTQV
jgi:hypothetical protein